MDAERRQRSTARTAEGQTINALGGNDWLFSDFNANALYGGNGDDWLVSDFTIERVDGVYPEISSRQSGGSGNDNISISAQVTGEDWIYGGTFDFDVDGDDGDDSIWIEAAGDNAGGTNVVQGGGGDDVVYIYAAFAAADGGSVNVVDGGEGDDHIVVFADSGYNSGSVSTIQGGDGDDYIESHTGGSTGGSKAYGGDGNDTLIVDSTVAGDGGSSTSSYASGGVGHDTIEMNSRSTANGGGSVEHTAYGGRGNDVISSVASAGNFTTDGGYGFADALLNGGTGHDVLTATTVFSPYDDVRGGARLYGGAGNDRLRVYDGVENTLDGGTGDDVITGGSGADRIIGGAGADTLRGGEGNAAFVFQWIAGVTPDIRDTILDFGAGGWRGDDLVVVSAIDANVNRGGNQAFAFGGTTQKGIGFLWVENDPDSRDSLVMANNDGAQPLVIAVSDGDRPRRQ